MKLEVAIGEVVDKATILKIKSEKISDKNKLLFINKELNIILEMLMPIQTEYPEIQTYMKELYNINCSLWDIENSIREKERQQSFDEEFISLARSVYRNNDVRASIKNKINIYTKSDLREVKQYTEYK